MLASLKYRKCLSHLDIHSALLPILSDRCGALFDFRNKKISGERKKPGVGSTGPDKKLISKLLPSLYRENSEDARSSFLLQETEFRVCFFLPCWEENNMNSIIIDQSLATFASVADMDKTVRRFLYTHGHKLTDSAVNLLKRLARYSCKVVGVSWAEAETLASKLGISVRTFWRAVKQLESYGIIARIPRRKKRGERTSNIYQIQPIDGLQELPSSSGGTRPVTLPLSLCEEPETPTETTAEASFSGSETESFKTGLSTEEKNKDVKEIRIPSSRPWKHVPKNVPEDFASPVLRDTADGKIAFKLWGKALLLDRLCGFAYQDTVTEIATETWKRTRSLYKERDFDSFCGLFYGALKRVTIEKFPALGELIYKR